MSLSASGENGDVLEDGTRENGDILADDAGGGKGLLMSAAGEYGDRLDDRVWGGTAFSMPLSDLDGDGGGGSLCGDRGGPSIIEIRKSVLVNHCYNLGE